MEQTEIRAVIKYFVKEGMKVKEIHANFQGEFCSFIGDRHPKVREIAEAVGMSSECVYHILTEELEMKKLSTRWVPQSLTLDHKHTSMEMFQQSLTSLQRNRQEFLHRFVTTDETWVHYYTPETKL